MASYLQKRLDELKKDNRTAKNVSTGAQLKYAPEQQVASPKGLDPAKVAASIAAEHDWNEDTRTRKKLTQAYLIADAHDRAENKYRSIADTISQSHDAAENTRAEGRGQRASVLADTLRSGLGSGSLADWEKNSIAKQLREEMTRKPETAKAYGQAGEWFDVQGIDPATMELYKNLYTAAHGNRVENAMLGIGTSIKGNLAAIPKSIAQNVSDAIAYRKQFDGNYWTTPTKEYQAAREAAGYGDRPLEDDTYAMRMREIGQNYKGAATGGLSEDGLGETKYFSPKWLAEQGISIAENAPNIALSAISPALGTAYMVANAGGGRALELAEQGVGTQAAVTRGLISGGIEALTEKVSIDNLLGALTNNKGALLNILSQMFTEASEETASYVLNYAADMAAKDPNAQFSMEELIDSALGGAFSGGFYGGIGQIGRKSAESVQRTMGENSRKNYEQAKAQDAGRTPDFDRQFDHYNKLGESGIEFEQIPDVPSATPIDEAVKRGAYLTGKNDGLQKAQNLADKALQGETLTDSEIDSVLGHKETRQHFESAAGVKFSRSNAENRKTVREYVEAEQKKPRFVKNEYSAEFGTETEEMFDRMAKRGGVHIEIIERIEDGSAGKYTDGKILVNAEKLREDRAGTLRTVVMHELTHHIETSEQYGLLKNGIKSYLESKGVDIDYELEILAEEYEANGVDLLDDDRIWREYIAKNVETLLSDEDSVRYLARENRGLFDKIREFLRDLVMKIKGTQDEKTVRELLKIYDHALDTVDAHPENRYKGEQHELYSDFSELFQVWYDSKKPYERLTDGGYFKIGTTSEALKSIGVRDGEIVWRKYKIGYIMEDHSEMSPEVIKQVPGVLENPVAVLKSKTRDDSIVLFGDVVAENGNKVMAALELTPSAVGKMEADFSLLTSAYSRSDSNIRNLVENSEILYLDENKKRTDTWLMSLGVQFPSDQPSYGSIGSIEYSNKSVKVKGVPFTGIFTKFEDKTSATVSQQGGSNAIRNSGQTSVGRSIDELRAQGQQMTPEERKAYVEASRERRAKLRELSEKYGEIPKGERPAREIAMPKQTNDDTRVRRFARTAAEASVLSDEQAGAIEQAVLDGVFDYEPIGDQDAVSRAEAKILRDAEQAKRDWAAVIGSNDRITKNDIALGEVLLKQAAEEGNTDEVIRLTAEIAAAGTRAGQIVQAMRLLKQMGGAGQLAGVETLMNQYQKDLDKRYGKKSPQLEIPDELKQDLAKAKTDEEIEQAKDAIFRHIASQIPNSWSDKWNAWRYLAMLGNPRTHIRNVVGNAAFAPMVGVKNVLGAALETTFVKDGEERTKTLKPASRAARDFAKADYAEMKEMVQHGGKYNDGQKIDDYRTVFTNKALEWARKANGSALEKEDGIFLGMHYKTAMASYLTANNIDVEKLGDGSKESAKILDKARAYAIREAQRATYRDVSQTAELIAQTARRGNPAVRTVIEGVLPFKKTPINILKRGLEYSPAGLVKVLYKSATQVKNGKYSANELIDDFAATLTGTGVLLLGYMMTSMGLLTGGGDDEDESRWYKDMLGYQSYALQVGDTSYTIDWMAPGSMPLFVGAELFNLKHGGKLDTKDLLGAMELVTAPLNNMSMLSGLNDTLDNLAYGGDTDNALYNLFSDSVMSYLSQAVPTLGGQVARTIDGTRRTTFADKNNSIPDSLEKTLQKAGNKIPFLSQTNPAYINLWGETEETENPIYRFMTNALSPGYVDTVKVDALDEELLRLYDATGENVFPDSAGRSIRVDGETIKFTVDEFQTYATTLGQTSHEILYGLVDKLQYKNADDTDKATAVGLAYDYANALAKSEVSDYELDGWIAKAHEGSSVGLSPEDYILYKLACVRADADENNSITQDEAEAAIKSMNGLSKKQKAYLWQSQNKSWKAEKNPFK